MTDDSLHSMAGCLLLVLFLLPLSYSGDPLVNEFFDKRIAEAETSLSDDDFERARESLRVKRDTDETEEEVDDSAMYNSDRFEGDIVNNGLSSKNIRSFVGDEPATIVQGVMRNAVRQSYLLWPDGRIPYTISSQYSTLSRQRIAEAIDAYSQNTCISFVPRKAGDTEYIHIMPDDGCYSLVGRTGGKQTVSLGDGCIQKGIIEHELMHTVGFFHEQSRADRDDYVTINWQNVENGLQDQFDKYSLTMIDHLGTAYDYGSIMHYAKTAFSKNGKPTITPKQSNVVIGQRRGFSTNDLYKINKLYKCPAKAAEESGTSLVSTKATVTTTTTRTVVKNCFDRRADCKFMARAGHCKARFSQHYMQMNCAVSCGVCEETATSSTCEDTRSWCGRWASSGMCHNAVFQDYMHSNCRSSCRLC